MWKNKYSLDSCRQILNIPAAGQLPARLARLRYLQARLAQRVHIAQAHVVFGQSSRTRWDILLHGSVINRFLDEVRDATVQVVPLAAKENVDITRGVE